MTVELNTKIEFENHFSARVIEILFPEGCFIRTREHLQFLKTKWQANLKSWHTPYTCVFDLRNFHVDENLNSDFIKLLKFFEKFHMKKIIGFKVENSLLPEGIFFDVFASYDEAIQHTGLAKGAGLTRNVANLRDRIVIENDFHAHVMEISFLTETNFDTKADIQILKSKIQNILRLWHTPYSVLFNCVNLKFSDEAKKSFLPVEKFLKGFFCKEILGYSPCDSKDNYPFFTYRSRHVAAGKLESIGAQAGDSARCS